MIVRDNSHAVCVTTSAQAQWESIQPEWLYQTVDGQELVVMHVEIQRTGSL
ncbi:hypothetical protein HG66A1_40480 [Gimesia chilikensis]|uniref:Uncharacterized protein n=1 Tax=Gimesia chilikensis TaxID=2605989 RepID=A0A517PSA4_9PLAN|nr:hypothetical protein HG66A1_40480 [Gimesia chilikensis]